MTGSWLRNNFHFRQGVNSENKHFLDPHHNFIRAYTELFRVPPDSMAATGYDAMTLLGIAIKNAQTLNPSDVREALSKITDYQGATLISHYDSNRHPVKSVVINTIRDGQIELHRVVEP